MRNAYVYVVLGDSQKYLDMSIVLVKFLEIWKCEILEVMEFHRNKRILLWNMHTYLSMSVYIHTYIFVKFFISKISGHS